MKHGASRVFMGTNARTTTTRARIHTEASIQKYMQYNATYALVTLLPRIGNLLRILRSAIEWLARDKQRARVISLVLHRFERVLDVLVLLTPND